ncbi:cytidine deaminase [Williamsia sp. 1135]|uniref:cytidine deaminase n=1 Tax=Williamsia sp. 1135 TaxID=1889262 RepID=UPI000A114B2D|nr:cytidine deaminase [Williamsia sp. 1135]ORM29095.1 cytidine deaminase [Williamsia sp. 1135]
MSTQTAAPELDDEDQKLLTLARGAMGRAEAKTGAAVRDTDGRTYAAGPVSLAALHLSALQVAVAMAVSSGAPGFEAAVLVGTADDADDPGLAALTEVSADAYAVMVATV